MVKNRPISANWFKISGNNRTKAPTCPIQKAGLEGQNERRSFKKTTFPPNPAYFVAFYSPKMLSALV
jgi:hypothetical protein